MKINFLNIFVIISLIISSCKSDKPKPEEDDNQVVIEEGNTLLIVNEGNFQWGNASVSVYNDLENEVGNNVFENKNNRSLGDVFQSAYILDDKIYLVVNNSSKIEVVKKENFESIATITGLQSPRYMQAISNNRALVTDIYANKLHVVNLTSNQKISEIALKGWTEQMLKVDDKVFVCNLSSEYLYWVNESNLSIDSTALTYGPNSMVVDNQGFLWVLCSGKSSESIAPKLYKINTSDMQIESQFAFSNSTPAPKNLQINQAGTEMIYLQNDVFKLSTNSTQLPGEKIISSNNNSNFYKLSIHPKNNEIYLSDALDYTQRGDVYRYSFNGTLIDKFKAGIIPSHVYLLD